MDKWEKTKQYIKDLPRDCREIIEKRMENDPTSVKVIRDKGKGKFYEWSFFNNSFQCFIEFQEFTKANKEDFVRYMAFNEEKSVCFLREPLLEDLLD